MTSLITLPNEHFVVTVPEGITQFKLVNDASGKPFQALFGRGYPFPITELEGSYTIVALGSDISEEQAAKIVERDYFDGVGFQYANYQLGFRKWTFGKRFNSALESLRSLLPSKGISRDYLIVKKRNEI